MSSQVLEQGLSNLCVHLNPPEGLLEYRCWSPSPEFLILIELEQGPRMHIADSFPGDADPAGVETTL